MDRCNAENQDRRAHLLGLRAHLAPQTGGRGAQPLPRATVPQPQVGQEQEEGDAMTTRGRIVAVTVYWSADGEPEQRLATFYRGLGRTGQPARERAKFFVALVLHDRAGMKMPKPLFRFVAERE